MRGMSTPLSIVIIIAVTVAIAAGFITWVMTLWYSRQEPEILQIYPDTKIVKEGNQWKLLLHVRNLGVGQAEIYKVEIISKETIQNTYTVPPSTEKTLEIPLTEDYSGNPHYQLQLYLKSGNVYTMISWIVTTQ